MGQQILAFLGREEIAVDFAVVVIGHTDKEGCLRTANKIKKHHKIPVLLAFSDDCFANGCKDRLCVLARSLHFESVVEPFSDKKVDIALQTAMLRFELEENYQEGNTATENNLNQYEQKLEELENTIRVMNEYREEIETKTVQRVLRNLRELVVPHIETLRIKCNLDGQNDFLDIIQKNIKKITDPYYKPLWNDIPLTPMEIRIADLIRQGRTSKEIAYLLGITTRGVTFHRSNIRKKIKIHGTNTNLKSALSELQP
ncbi:hypothetical protein DSCO28_16270 [Desulfosarcina ovata subsp. sediminis]|uniref:HTH luxR-type domain-containing protein n=1 Tax=Desulfosarcina ovata subsp. sediminis TaxID=885957 RepID=A0A5K7ZJK5_9BACT|nr:helix-turn-helix transcriptional regulator [Desulfosarcina ovata]BBO81061.1 hypothetical protein DSCO28_16270 [Desulfosarcina ovata subsp. sediminis]